MKIKIEMSFEELQHFCLRKEVHAAISAHCSDLRFQLDQFERVWTAQPDNLPVLIKGIKDAIAKLESTDLRPIRL